MTEDNKLALEKANELSISIQNYLEVGNMEMAHRVAGVYQSIMLTILVTELVPGAQEFLNEISKRSPKAPKGTILQ